MDVPPRFLKKELLARGLRPSFQSIKVLEYLFQHPIHPTVDSIYQQLSPEIPSLSKATIYNILHRFEKSGLVCAVNIDTNEAHYDLLVEPHGHFQCSQCGSIFNFSIDFGQLPANELEGFQIQQRNVFYRGLCPNCIQNPQP